MNSLNKDIRGKRIKLLEIYLHPELDTGEDFIVKDGFGASDKTSGTALFIKSTKTGKVHRINGLDKIKLVR